MSKKSPLDGIKILDLTMWQMGPQATAMLADMGAEVIKIEDPFTGDPSRGLLFKDPAQTHGIRAYFETMSRNKKSITLNLKDEKGRQIFYQLVKKADVVTLNWSVGVAERLGVDYKTLVKYNPKIIVAAGTPYGSKGPDAQLGANDLSSMARSGLSNYQTQSAPGSGIFYSLCAEGDAVAAIVLAYSVLLAIIARDRFGVGQHVETSLLSSLMWLQTLPLGIYLVQGDVIPAYQRATGRNFLFRHYPCGDGKWIAVSKTQPQKHWANFFQTIGLSYVMKEPRFIKIIDSLNIYGTLAGNLDMAELSSLIDKAFMARPAKDWVNLLNEKEIDCTLVSDYADLVTDPQVIANEYITELQHRAGVPIKYANPPVKLSETPGHIDSTAPEFGQHTEEVLLAAGYTWDQLGEFRKDHVI